MNDVSRLVSQARSHLTQGLAALQAPGIPREVAENAVPVAHAMGLLHLLYPSGVANTETLPMVLSTLQRALHQLQWSTRSHPALDQAVDHVAAALGSVFTLSATPPSAPAPLVASAAAPPRPAAPQAAAAPPIAAARAPQAAPASAAKQAPAVFNEGPRGPASAPASAAPATLPQPGQATRPASATAPVNATAAAPAKAKSAGPPPTPRGPDPLSPLRKEADLIGSAATDAAGLLRVDAALAANSATNFYRGFDGNDVIAHGGLFVATYNIPELNERVAVRLSMPGGHEFLAQGTVRWRRLAAPGGSHAPEAPPGFGLRFVDVPAAARELITRYVNNREPLFHDD
jgi:hypothetical protein